MKVVCRICGTHVTPDNLKHHQSSRRCRKQRAQKCDETEAPTLPRIETELDAPRGHGNRIVVDMPTGNGLHKKCPFKSCKYYAQNRGSMMKASARGASRTASVPSVGKPSSSGRNPLRPLRMVLCGEVLKAAHRLPDVQRHGEKDGSAQRRAATL